VNPDKIAILYRPFKGAMRRFHEGKDVRNLCLPSLSVNMSRNRDERGQYTEKVSLSDVLDVFGTVAGPVVTSSDVASVTGSSDDTARRKLETLHDRGRVGRRKTAGRVIYWRLDAADPDPVNPDDPIFTDRPSFTSGEENLSGQTDEILYGKDG